MGMNDLPRVAMLLENEGGREVFAPLLSIDHVILAKDKERCPAFAIGSCGEAFDGEVEVSDMTVSRPKPVLCGIDDFRRRPRCDIIG